MKRNWDKYTSADQARINILTTLNECEPRTRLLKSTLGYAAFPDYNFRWPQGAAFSVAKIVSQMEKLVGYGWDPRGYYITQKGRNVLRDSQIK